MCHRHTPSSKRNLSSKIFAKSTATYFLPLTKRRGTARPAAPLFVSGLAARGGIACLLAGSALIGIANGIGVPYLNTIGSVKAGKEAATTVMPLLSAALYTGQFVSPLIVSPIASAAGTSPYAVGVVIALIYLLQAFLTRKKQMLPENPQSTH